MSVEISLMSFEVDSHGDGAGDADVGDAGCVDPMFFLRDIKRFRNAFHRVFQRGPS